MTDLRPEDVVCQCTGVTRRQIEWWEALSVGQVQEKTGAGTCCGRCLDKVASLVTAHRVCTCEGVRLRDIEDAIDAGAHTVAAVQDATRAGTKCLGCVTTIMDIQQEHQHQHQQQQHAADAGISKLMRPWGSPGAGIEMPKMCFAADVRVQHL
eukprot:m51a1_g9824 hypothetical protein (153) ;mRNA; f:1909126-1909703